MATKSVLIVDDSVVIQGLLRKALEADGHDPHPVGSGERALERIRGGGIDLVILDVEMPGLSGLETLAQLRHLAPRVPVVMFSAHTADDADSTLEALALGAAGYVLKPSSARGVASCLRDDLLPLVQELLQSRQGQPTPCPALRLQGEGAPSKKTIEAVVIGASTGGPKAIETLALSLPPSLPVPVLLAQHMPPVFTERLAARLEKATPFSAREARHGESPRAGTIYLAPGDFHLRLAHRANQVVMLLDQEPAEHACRPAVDPLFRSAAVVYGRRALGVVLTGMGKDGLNGSRHLVEAGAEVLVQDEETSVVWGMPGHVAREGLATDVLPLLRLGPAVGACLRRGRRQSARSA